MNLDESSMESSPDDSLSSCKDEIYPGFVRHGRENVWRQMEPERGWYPLHLRKQSAGDCRIPGSCAFIHCPPQHCLSHVSIATVQIPADGRPKEISMTDLPASWRDYPAPPELTELGTGWALSTETLLLRVPSAVVLSEFNILINPLHPDMKHVTISDVQAYRFDDRLLH